MKGSRASPARTPRSEKSRVDFRSSPPAVKTVEKPFASYFYVEHSDNERFTVNANCICKLIYEFIRLKAGLPDQFEFDLCDVNGKLLNFYESDEGAYGQDLFDHKETYYIVLLERTPSGFLYNPRLQLHAAHPDFQRLMKSIMKIFQRLSDDLNLQKKRAGKRKTGSPDKPSRTIHKHHPVIF